MSGDPILQAESLTRSASSAIESESSTTEVSSKPTPEILSEGDLSQEEIFFVRLDILDLSDVTARIDCERVRLQWQPQCLQQYCLDQYGRIRARLTDDELISLLLALRQLEIGLN